MTSEDYKATPEQWLLLERSGGVGLLAAESTCILELRARVEALEEAQRPRVFTADEVAPIVVSAAPAPAGSLVERVANAMQPGTSVYKGEARDALREVAAWLMDQYTDADDCIPSEIGPVISRLREEADRG